MPLSLEQAITQLDSGWLNQLQTEGYGGDALRQAVVLALYAQQQAAARNSSGFKAGIARVNGWLTQPLTCDNNGDYQFTADWRDEACGCTLSIDYAADPANWRLTFRLPSGWPHSTDNLDVTETRAVEHDFALWLANAVHWCCAKLIEQQVGDEARPVWQQQQQRALDWAGFEHMNPAYPVARVDFREVSAAWCVQYPDAARESLQANFDDMAAVLLRVVSALQAAAHAGGKLAQEPMARPRACGAQTAP